MGSFNNYIDIPPPRHNLSQTADAPPPITYQIAITPSPRLRALS